MLSIQTFICVAYIKCFMAKMILYVVLSTIFENHSKVCSHKVKIEGVGGRNQGYQHGLNDGVFLGICT